MQSPKCSPTDIARLIVSPSAPDCKILCPDASSSNCIPQCISKLTGESLRDLFSVQLPRNVTSQGTSPAQLRLRLGVWYGTLYLATLRHQRVLGQNPLQVRMKALASEALMWHEYSFLSHVLVYYRVTGSEEVTMASAVQRPAEGTPELGTFMAALQKYVDRSGTSVRAD